MENGFHKNHLFLLPVVLVSLAVSKLVLFVSFMQCVPEDKRMTQPKTSVAKHAAFSTSTGSDDSQVKLEEHHTSEESNAADMAVVAVAVTTGLIVLVALIIFATIALARKRGMFQHTGVRCQSGCVGMELVK
jgi:hypothetical protein